MGRRRGTEYSGVPDAVGPGFQSIPDVSVQTGAAGDGWWTGAFCQSFGVPPSGKWLKCDGAIYPIAQYPALGTLLGATFGGNGATTFAVPSLCGRFALNKGASGAAPTVGSRAGQLGHTHGAACGLPDATCFSVLSVPAPPVPPDNLATSGHKHAITVGTADPPYTVIGDTYVHI